MTDKLMYIPNHYTQNCKLEIAVETIEHSILILNPQSC